jgi:PDZ domain/Aspartyl protease
MIGLFKLRCVRILAVAALMVVSALVLSLAGGVEPLAQEHDKQVGKQFQIPYQLTETNHFLVRVRINGKGPFNFLVDSGAPSLFIATEAARKIRLKVDSAKFWTAIDRLDLEGGVHLGDIKARVDDPFQLVGMNALGLPGASIDGILGFTILARFRLEINLTKDRMIWTRLDYEPHDPPVQTHKPSRGSVPIGVQAMSALGPLAKGIAFLMGKQPEAEHQPRGFLGLEWSEKNEASQTLMFIVAVLDGSPAARGGVQPGDCVIRLNDRAVKSLKDAHSAVEDIRAGDRVALVVERGLDNDKRKLTLTLTAGEGL